MAKMNIELPNETIKELEKISKGLDGILADMVKAGADTVIKNIKKNVPESFHSSNIMDCLYETKAYKTPSDGGINVKVCFDGYFINKRGVQTPAPLVVNVFEFGASKQQKKPFFRRSFRKAEIEKAMLEAQKKASGGLLI